MDIFGARIDDFKKQKGQKIEKYFWKEKDVLLNMEKKVFKIHQDSICTTKS